MGADNMLKLGDMIKKEDVEIKGDERDILCLRITASWEDIIKGEGEQPSPLTQGDGIEKAYERQKIFYYENIYLAIIYQKSVRYP